MNRGAALLVIIT